MKQEKRLKSKPMQTKNQPPKTPPNAMADCVFSEDIMICILTRVPVKSILRFKSVCKPWLQLLSTPGFRKLHNGQFSSDPNNQSFIVLKSQTMFFFNIDSNEKNEFPHRDMVGCCNGLACVRVGHDIVLWNPAMRLSKTVSPLKHCGRREKVSLGFGYDAEGDDFKVVRIVCLENKGKIVLEYYPSTTEIKYMMVNRVQVYSVNSDSWTTIDPGFRFSDLGSKNDGIVNGNPYWLVNHFHSQSATNPYGDALVCFDVRKLAFRIVPLSGLIQNLSGIIQKKVEFVEWKGSLGGLVYNRNDGGVTNSVDVWVFNDGEQFWRKNHTFVPPVGVHVRWFMPYSKRGEILVVLRDGKLCVLIPETGCVKELFHGADRINCIYPCTESLAYL